MKRSDLEALLPPIIPICPMQTPESHCKETPGTCDRKDVRQGKTFCKLWILNEQTEGRKEHEARAKKNSGSPFS